MPSTHKKVIIRKLDRDSMQGHVTTSLVDGKLEILNLAGKLVTVDLKEVKGVYFVRDFGDTEDLIRKTFTTRPRTEGLWVRLQFRDNDVLEGMMPNDLTQILPEGYFVNPPDARSNTQRIFVYEKCPERPMRARGDRCSRRAPPQAYRSSARFAPSTHVQRVNLSFAQPDLGWEHVAFFPPNWNVGPIENRTALRPPFKKLWKIAKCTKSAVTRSPTCFLGKKSAPPPNP